MILLRYCDIYCSTFLNLSQSQTAADSQSWADSRWTECQLVILIFYTKNLVNLVKYQMDQIRRYAAASLSALTKSECRSWEEQHFGVIELAPPSFQTPANFRELGCSIRLLADCKTSAPLRGPGFVLVPASLNLRGLFMVKLVASTESKQHNKTDLIRSDVLLVRKMLKFLISVSQKFLVDAGRCSLADMRY